jgi:hypothetical protein
MGAVARPTTDHAAQAALTRYLRRATWGLPRPRQQQLWDELEDHLLSRAAELQGSGAAPHDALARALAEVGSPLRVCAGMTQVYAMPKLILAACSVALVASAAIYAAAGGRESVFTLPVLSYGPDTFRCVGGDPGVVQGQSNNLVAVARAALMNSFKQPCSTVLFAGKNDDTYIRLSDLRRVFESLTFPVTDRPSGGLSVGFPNGAKSLFNSDFEQGGQIYIHASALLTAALHGVNTPDLRLYGYDNPVVDFGSFRLQVGSSTAPATGASFYTSPAMRLFWISALLAPAESQGWSGSIYLSGPTDVLARHTVKTKLHPGEVVLLALRTDTSTPDHVGAFVTDVAPVEEGGLVTFKIPQAKIRFIFNPTQLGPEPSGGRINALLVRVTHTPLNNLKSGIVVPAQATSDAR